MPTVYRVSILVLCGFIASPFSAMADGFRVRPHIQNVTPDGATLIWETQDSGVARLEYGLSTASLDRTATESTPSKIHRLRMSGLMPNTTYAYRVKAGEDVQEASFVTAPDTDEEMVFVVVGDSRRWGNRWKETGMNEHVKQWNADLYLTMGDLVGDGHEYDQWPEHFSRFQELTQSKWFVTARGNHEGSLVRDTDNDWFAKYHELPGGGEPYAYFDWGNTHFVLISYESTGRARDWSKSAEWLDAHLDGVDKKYTVVAHHFPVYCTGYDSTSLNRKEPGVRAEDFRNVLDKHNVTLDCSGHTHIYERHYPLRNNERNDREGTFYVVNGGDINANYPDWWTAVSDDRETLAKPTYTVFHCKDDRVLSRTFAWSKVEEKIVLLDRFVIWEDEAIPRKVLESLASLEGAALVEAVDELAAMLYAPAAKVLLGYLENPNQPVRHAAAKAIALIANEEIAEEVLEQVHNGDAVISAYMARALEVATPKKLIREIEKLVADYHTPNRARFHLVGALQFHASPKLTTRVAMDLLDGDMARPDLRRRAAYALGQTATSSDVKDLAYLVGNENDRYVAMTLAWKLNNLTKRRVSLSSNGAFAKSKPGKRGEFIKKWRGK